MRNVFEEAMATAPRGNWLDDLAYASLQAASAKFFPQSETFLSVKILGDDVKAWERASVSMALQDAVGRLGALIRNPKTEHVSRNSANRDRVALLEKGSAGNTSYFGFPKEEIREGALSEEATLSLAEMAMRELFDILPQSESDDASIDALIALRSTEKAAVDDLAKAIHSIANDVEFRLVSQDAEKVRTSSVSVEQARVIRDTLEESKTVVNTMQLAGVLDGMRTTRRIFYLIQENGQTISGSIDRDLISQVKEAIGDQVRVTVEEIQRIAANGRRSRKTYRLIDLEVDEKLI